ncbi:MAG: hypothetical protein NT075_06870 [Chloroflexi bacterium]|nr:hypothetical protein [Chloroflexota bacterium]
MRQSAYSLENTNTLQRDPLVRRQEAVWGTPLRSASALHNGLEIWQYLEIIGRWLWLITLCGLVAGICAFIVSLYVMVPLYRSSVTLMVKTTALTNSNANSGHFNDYDTFLANEDMTLTFKELAQKRPVADAAAQSLGIDSDQLYGQIEIAVIPKTPLMVLSFESTQPDQAVAVANAAAAALIQSSKTLEWMPGRDLAVVEKAERPDEPVSPRIQLNIMVAIVVGAALALAAVVTVEYMRFVKRM